MAYADRRTVWHRRTLSSLILLVAVLAGAGSADARTTTLEQQRSDFQRAREALRKAQITQFRRLLKALDDYPLRLYLEYDDLKRRLYTRPTAEVRAFLAEHDGTPLAPRLRAAWLGTLARQGRWQTFLEDFRDTSSTRLQCLRVQALLETGQRSAAMQAVTPLWLVGRSQPRACDPVFDAWRADGHATHALIWERIRLAMHNRRPNLARYLARYLNKTDQHWVELWRRVYRRPATILKERALQKDTPVVREIVLHGLDRLARRDAPEAAKLWQQLKADYTFSAAEIGTMERRIALSAALQRSTPALTWLAALPAEQADETIKKWRVRTALLAQDWATALRWLDKLPEALRSEATWQYWRGRALSELGQRAAAEQLFAALATDHGYHSFLASDQLKLPYQLDGDAIEYEPQELAALASRPGIVRASELYLLGMITDARREWRAATRPMSERELQLASVLAHQWGWHDRAIVTAGQSDHLGDLKLRFPVVFRSQIMNNARRNNIDPAWVFGVMRQESAYMTDARSGAGALGLMQLMPRTARHVARTIKLPLRRNHELLNANKNIRLGTAHLRQVLDQSQGNQVLATAAYNAGMQRVKRWRPVSGELPADIWIETVPFHETRSYVKRVLASTAIFEKHLGRPVTPLPQRMPVVAPAS